MTLIMDCRGGRMKKIDSVISNIEVTSEMIDKNITYHTTATDMNRNGNSIISYNFKEFITLVGTCIVPTIFLIAAGNEGINNVLPEYRWKAILGNVLFWGILIFSFVLYFFLKYIYSSRFLNRFRSSLIIVGLLEVSLIIYGSLFLFNIFPHSNFFLMSLTLVIYFIFSILLIKVILEVQIKETLNKKYEQNLKISKWGYYLSRYPAVVLGVIIMSAFVYKSAKSVFILTHNDNPVSFLYSLIGGIGFLLIGLSISLLPTLLFDSELYIRGKILQKNPEYFRKKFEFSKEEWYSE